MRRFIPAYAGNTATDFYVGREVSVHPRVCGEHLSVTVHPRKFPGSSPRMRGTHLHFAGKRESGRFIPAYAGNTP